MQKFLASGRMVKDAEIKMMQSGKQLASFTIAVQRDFKNKETGNYESDFFSCVAFGGTAEYIGNYVQKGNKVLICGKMQNNNWEKDGVKHYGDKIVVENCEGLTPKKHTPEYGYDSSTGEVTEDYGGKDSKSSKGEMESFGKPVPFSEEIPF